MNRIVFPSKFLNFR